MKRALRIVGVFAVVGVMVFALWTTRTPLGRRPASGSLKDAMHSAITNPVAFAKNRFTGGVGAVLMIDLATGLPLIKQVLAGSPAEQAGLREGDFILQIDGVATQGRTLAQNVESIRGFIVGSVTLTVRRSGSTNVQCVIRRSSWNSLGLPQ